MKQAVWIRTLIILGIVGILGLALLTESCSKLSDNPGSPSQPGNPTPGTDQPNPWPTATPIPANLIIDDSLIAGSSHPARIRAEGGSFTPEGFRVTKNIGGYIAYEIDTTRSLKVEFDAIGFRPREEAGHDANLFIFQMFDGPIDTSWLGHGAPAWQLYRLYVFQKFGIDHIPDAINATDGIGLRCHWSEYKSYRGASAAGHPIRWDPTRKYHWVFDITPSWTTVTRDGEVLFSQDCSRFTPSRPKSVLLIGGATAQHGNKRMSPTPVTYSNVKVFRQ